MNKLQRLISRLRAKGATDQDIKANLENRLRAKTYGKKEAGE